MKLNRNGWYEVDEKQYEEVLAEIFDASVNAYGQIGEDCTNREIVLRTLGAIKAANSCEEAIRQRLLDSLPDGAKLSSIDVNIRQVVATAVITSIFQFWEPNPESLAGAMVDGFADACILLHLAGSAPSMDGDCYLTGDEIERSIAVAKSA